MELAEPVPAQGGSWAPPIGSRSGLAVVLRAQTAAAHAAAEDAFALDTRLASRGSYGALLALLSGFYRPLEAALAALPGWDRLTPAVDLPARSRAALIDDDLQALGLTIPVQALRHQPVLDSLAQGLGCLYVLEGSALGGRIVARQASAALGTDLPVSFFANPAGPPLGARWQALQATLDAYGHAAGETACAAAVLAAQQTFAALGDHLDLAGRLAATRPLDRSA